MSSGESLIEENVKNSSAQSWVEKLTKEQEAALGALFVGIPLFLGALLWHRKKNLDKINEEIRELNIIIKYLKLQNSTPSSPGP